MYKASFLPTVNYKCCFLFVLLNSSQNKFHALSDASRATKYTWETPLKARLLRYFE